MFEPTHHQQFLTNIQSLSSLRKIKNRMLWETISKCQKAFSQHQDLEMDSNTYLKQMKEDPQLYKPIGSDLNENNQEIQVENQMKDIYQRQCEQLMEEIKGLERQLINLVEQQKNLQIKKLAVIDTLKQQQITLLKTKSNLKQIQLQISQTNFTEITDSHTIQNNIQLIEHLKTRLQNNNKIISNLKQRINKKIYVNQYLENVIEKRQWMRRKLENVRRESESLEGKIQECKVQTSQYVRECQNDINAVVQKELNRALDVKYKIKANLTSAYNQLYQIISEQVMQNGRYQVFNILGEIPQEQ